MSSFAPYVNHGYFDVPICNQYSNNSPYVEPTKATKYNVNTKIFNTLNQNNESYVLDPDQPSLNQPSKSLYTESDIQSTGYYNNLNLKSYNNKVPINSTDFLDNNMPIVKKKEMVPLTESFYGGPHGGAVGGGPMGGGGAVGGRPMGGGGYQGGAVGGRPMGGGGHHGMGHYHPGPSNLYLGSYFPINYGGYGSYVDTVGDASYYNNIYPVYVEEPPVIIERPVTKYNTPVNQKEVVYIENVNNESEEVEKTKSKKKKKTKTIKKVSNEEKYDNESNISKKSSKNSLSNKTLWVIIIILSLIILLLIFYRLYEKKLLKF
jgi:hypothetical protein